MYLIHSITLLHGKGIFQSQGVRFLTRFVYKNDVVNFNPNNNGFDAATVLQSLLFQKILMINCFYNILVI